MMMFLTRFEARRRSWWEPGPDSSQGSSIRLPASGKHPASKCTSRALRHNVVQSLKKSILKRTFELGSLLVFLGLRPL